MQKIILLFAILCIIISCNNERKKNDEHLKRAEEIIRNKSLSRVRIDNSDTLAIMRLLADTTFLRIYTGDNSSLTSNNPFNDSIIFRKDIDNNVSDITNFFPEEVKLKFLTKDEICSFSQKNYSDTTHLPDFIQIRYFEKIGTHYIIQIQKTFVTLLFDKVKKHRQIKELNGIKSDTCIFNGQLLTDVVGIRFIITPDSVKTYFESGPLN